MTKLERFQKAYNYLLGKGEYHTKKGCGERLGKTRENVSGAYYGREPFFNNSFLKTFCREFPIINYEWLISGDGEMLTEQTSNDKNSATLIELAASLIKEVEGLRQQLNSEREAISKERAELHTILAKLRTSNYQIQTPSDAYLTAAEPNE